MSQQTDLMSSLLAVADDSTRAMFFREVGLRRLQHECPHDGGWRCLVGDGDSDESLWSCCGCGLVVKGRYDRYVREPLRVAAEEPSGALGYELAHWNP